MNRILFVDDEPNVLSGVQRMLYSLRNEWQMTFVSDGAQALRCLTESPFDVLVTDVRMPGMNGIELLRQVVERHPEVIRMVLSGTADIELSLQSVPLAHQYLMKPCDARTLRTAVQRAVCLRLLLHNAGLRDLVSRVQTLPSIPAVYGELLRTLQSSEASPQAVGTIVARDMGMTAKILQLVNSAFFGVSHEIVNPVDAVVYLGLETVRALAFTVSAFSQFKLPKSSLFSIDDLQKHCLAVGTLARRIARTAGLAPAAVDHAFVGGLLHDVGQLVLVSNYPQQYDEVLSAVRAGRTTSEAEYERFGTSHAEIGAYLLWLWHLPDPVTEVLALHHRPSRDPEVLAPVVAVHIADHLVNGGREEDLDLEAVKALGWETTLQDFQRMYEEVPERAAC